MCGRFYIDEELQKELDHLIQKINVHKELAKQIQCGEVCPSERAVILSGRNGKVVPSIERWGYHIPNSSKVVFNARSDTVESKKMFSADFRYRRCLVPVSGYYEWKHDKLKQKYYFTEEGVKVIYLAGIEGVSGNEKCFTILTTDANESMKLVHDRMPVEISRTDVRRWLFSYSDARILMERKPPLMNRNKVVDPQEKQGEPEYQQIHIFNTFKL